jgi:hypothetical protein
MSGENDISGLFGRVSALEQADEDTDSVLVQIIKNYPALGLTIRTRIFLHDNRLCGDTNPIFSATTSADTYL